MTDLITYADPTSNAEDYPDMRGRLLDAVRYYCEVNEGNLIEDINISGRIPLRVSKMIKEVDAEKFRNGPDEWWVPPETLEDEIKIFDKEVFQLFHFGTTKRSREGVDVEALGYSEIERRLWDALKEGKLSYPIKTYDDSRTKIGEKTYLIDAVLPPEMVDETELETL